MSRPFQLLDFMMMMMAMSIIINIGKTALFEP
jgi:hypothetical protein